MLITPGDRVHAFKQMQFATETKVLKPAEGIVQAIVNVTANRDSDGDVVVPGATAWGLNVMMPKGARFHDKTRVVARTLEATELLPGDKSLPQRLLDMGVGGLRVTGQYNLKTQDGNEAFESVQFWDDEQEWSVGYEIAEYFVGGGTARVGDDVVKAMLKLSANPAYQELMSKNLSPGSDPSRFITKWITFEWSDVMFGANALTATESSKDHTTVVNVTNGEPSRELESIKVLVDALETKDASGSTSLPIADRDTAWSGSDAEAAVGEAAGLDGDKPDWAMYGRAHFWAAPDASKKGDFKLPFATIVDGKMTAVPAGVFGAAGAMQGARGGASIPDGDVAAVKAKIARYYARMATQFDDDTLVAPWEGKSMTLFDERVKDAEMSLGFLAVEAHADMKGGRVQARRNEDRLRAMADTISSMLDEVHADADGDDDDAKSLMSGRKIWLSEGIEGTYEDTQEDICEAASALFNPAGIMGTYVGVQGTFPDHVIIDVCSPPDYEDEYYDVPWSYAADGETVILGTPKPIELTINIAPAVDDAPKSRRGKDDVKNHDFKPSADDDQSCSDCSGKPDAAWHNDPKDLDARKQAVKDLREFATIAAERGMDMSAAAEPDA